MPAPYQSIFYTPDALPDSQPTAPKHRRQIQLQNVVKTDTAVHCTSEMSTLTVINDRNHYHQSTVCLQRTLCQQPWLQCCQQGRLLQEWSAITDHVDCKNITCLIYEIQHPGLSRVNLCCALLWELVARGKIFLSSKEIVDQLECGPMPNVTVTLPNIGGALCSMLQSMADAHY